MVKFWGYFTFHNLTIHCIAFPCVKITDVKSETFPFIFLAYATDTADVTLLFYAVADFADDDFLDLLLIARLCGVF